jgi:hypothetical protein
MWEQFYQEKGMREFAWYIKKLVPFPVNNLVFHRQGAENAKSIGALYTHNFLACLASSWLKKYKLIFEKRH